MFAPEACLGMTPGSRSDTRWRGQIMELVDCLDDDGELRALHYYSPLHGMVLRSVREDGIAEEFRSPQRVELSDQRFHAPSAYRRVNLADFLNGPSEIEAFEVSGTD